MSRYAGRPIVWAGVVLRFADGKVWAVEFPDGASEAEICTEEDYDGYDVGPFLTRQSTTVRVRGRTARWQHGEDSAPPVPTAAIKTAAPLPIEGPRS